MSRQRSRSSDASTATTTHKGRRDGSGFIVRQIQSRKFAALNGRLAGKQCHRQKSVNIKNIIFVESLRLFYLPVLGSSGAGPFFFPARLSLPQNNITNNGSEPNGKEIELILISDYFKSLFFFVFARIVLRAVSIRKLGKLRFSRSFPADGAASMILCEAEMSWQEIKVLGVKGHQRLEEIMN